MRLERGLPADLYLGQVVDRLDAPAFIVDCVGDIAHCNHAATQWQINAVSPKRGDNLITLLGSESAATLGAYLSDQAGGPSYSVQRATLSTPLTLARMSSSLSHKQLFLCLAAPASAEPIAAIPKLSSVTLPDWIDTFEDAGKGLWFHDFLSKQSYLSGNWYDLRGLPRDTPFETSRDAWFSYMHPDDRPRLRRQLAEIDGGETDLIEYDFRERKPDGSWVWIQSRGRVLLRDATGMPIRMFGTDTDITDAKDSSEKATGLAKSLELSMRVARIGAWEYNYVTGHETWDAQMFEIYGIDPATVGLDHNLWEDHLHEDDKEEAIRQAELSSATGEDFALDYRVRKLDGTVRHIRSIAAHHEDAFGTRKLIGVNWDITPDIEAAEQLRQANVLAQQQNAALEAARAQMERDALHDALTGLANRRKLDEFQRSLDAACVPAVLHIDLDRFKEINDTLGHAAGDQILIHAATILSDAAPKGALVARVGGDEFVIFIANSPDNETLGELAKAIITRARDPYVFDGTECRFGMSVGIATDHLGPFTGSELFANADLALYLAKEEGRGRFRFYTADLKVSAQARKECADDILAGLEQDAFFCLYQPQFDAKTLDLTGVEALVRWNHPSGEVWSPDRFLPVAQQLDVVSKIDRLVLMQTLRDTRNWQAAGLQVPRISVNVSANRLTDPFMPEDLALLRTAPGEFAFELLESIFLDTSDPQLDANLNMIRSMGVDIEVDDFGTGHASIVGLLNLKPSRLKIDRQLIQPIDTCDKQRILIQSIIQIGHTQGIAIVAEGVETAEHITILQDLGCDFLQGFGLASPTRSHDLGALLTAAQSLGRYTPFMTGSGH